MAVFTKQVESSISTIRENSTVKSLSGKDLVYTLANRTLVDEKEGHYFSSFNLPYSYDSLGSGTTLAQLRPEILQLNVDKILLVQISRNNYSEFIDGRSITLNIPQQSGNTIKITSAFYSESDNTVKTNVDSVLGESIAFLFSDDINKPYTGTTENTTINRSGISTWDPTNDFKDRPNAVAYRDVADPDKNSDQRPWSSVTLASYVPENYPNSLDQGYNYDVPVGFAALDKGFFIITHPSIVDNIPWSAGSVVSIGGYADTDAGEATIISSGSTADTTNIVFTANTSTANFEEIYTTYSTSVVCIAMPKEFFISTNPTWDRATNLAEVQNETYNLDSIFVTQVGLYNVEGDLLAVAKLDRPIEKSYSNILTFNLNIEV